MNILRSLTRKDLPRERSLKRILQISVVRNCVTLEIMSNSLFVPFLWDRQKTMRPHPHRSRQKISDKAKRCPCQTDKKTI
jgi:hypothetical protein